MMRQTNSDVAMRGSIETVFTSGGLLQFRMAKLTADDTPDPAGS